MKLVRKQITNQAAKDKMSNPKYDVELLECRFVSPPPLRYHVQSSPSADEVSCSSYIGRKKTPFAFISVILLEGQNQKRTATKIMPIRKKTWFRTTPSCTQIL
jgi:hypothetical protein